MRWYLAVIVVYAAVPITVSAQQESSSTSSHDSHEHEHSHDEHSGLFEQSGVYDMNAGLNNLFLFPTGEDATFEEASLAFMIVPADTADEEGLEGAEEVAESAWEAYVEGTADASLLLPGDSAEPSATIVFQVSPNASDSVVVVPIDVTDDGAYAVFLEHGADEAPVVVTSATGDILTAGASEGLDTEEGHEDHDHEDHDEEEGEEDTSPATARQWGNALGASVVLSLCSLAGLLIVVNAKVAASIDLSHACIFACGALLTASILHIIPESLEGLSTDFDSLHDMGIAAGVALLAGVSLGVVLHAMLETGHSHGPDSQHHTNQHDALGRPEAGDAASAAERGIDAQKHIGTPVPALVDDASAAPTGGSTPLPSPTSVSDDTGASLHVLMEERKGTPLTDIKNLQPVCWNLIIGDLVHNFADGVTIGAAFLGCSPAVGWTVTASAVFHEVPHELADFMALVNGGMSKGQAFFYNFVSALSAVLGVILILSLRETLTSAQVSYILLIGAGSFIFIALSELVPAALAISPAAAAGNQSLLRGQALKLVSFVAGAFVIGIPLIFDQHCEAGHAGHDH